MYICICKHIYIHIYTHTQVMRSVDPEERMRTANIQLPEPAPAAGTAVIYLLCNVLGLF